MVTVGVRVRVRVSVRVGTAFVLTLVPGSGMHFGLRFLSGFVLHLRLRLGLGLGYGLRAGVGIKTIIDIAIHVVYIVVYSISGICELNTICHVEKPTFTSK